MAFVKDLSGNSPIGEPDVAIPRTVEPANDSNPHTPSDTEWVRDSSGNRRVARALVASTGGTIKLETPSGIVSTAVCADNVMLPHKFVRILSTGTTASGFTVFF